MYGDFSGLKAKAFELTLPFTPDSLPPYRMGECEKAARSRGLLQSHSAFAQTSEDFEDPPSISGYGDKTLSEKDWAKLLLQGSVQSNMGDVDDLHPPLDYTLHPEVLLTLQNTSANQSAAAVEGVTQLRFGVLFEFQLQECP